eukprot:6866970-Lingulodinium_polyedra.AAC.1
MQQGRSAPSWPAASSARPPPGGGTVVGPSARTARGLTRTPSAVSGSARGGTRRGAPRRRRVTCGPCAR